MSNNHHDLVLVGGGLAGSALALVMARRGAKVLIVEPESVFRDRIRGEGTMPWGVAEARELGIFELLRDTCGHEVRFFDTLIQGFGRSAIFYPLRGGRVRTYLVYHRDVLGERLSGDANLPRFFEGAVQAGAPAEWLDGARAAGPLATFEGADIWVQHPYRAGVALVGDAAAASDPSFGQGLSLTLRDVRVLRDALLRDDDWDAAGHAYAAEHDRYYATLRTVEDWFTRLFMEVGPAADARRARALPLLMQDPTRAPDALFSGPNQPLGDEDRIRFLGE